MPFSTRLVLPRLLACGEQHNHCELTSVICKHVISGPPRLPNLHQRQRKRLLPLRRHNLHQCSSVELLYHAHHYPYPCANPTDFCNA
jgi:hypothetical protein